MARRTSKRLFDEFVALGVATLLMYFFDPLLAMQLHQASLSSPAPVAPLWEAIAVIFQFNIELILAWLACIGSLVMEFMGNS
jgi:hypothetical protein